jgi:hypothetical protein
MLVEEKSLKKVVSNVLLKSGETSTGRNKTVFFCLSVALEDFHIKVQQRGPSSFSDLQTAEREI